MDLPSRMFNVVLVHPEIPHNTGAAGRLCLATGATLHLVEPLGFSLEEKQVRRVGLDYWQHVDLKLWTDWESLQQEIEVSGKRPHLCTTKGTSSAWERRFSKGDWLIFGRETAGLSDEIRDCFPEDLVRLPMVPESTRSLNLATTVGIILYEAARQCAEGGEMV